MEDEMGKLKELYKSIWKEREHLCQNCGVYIPSPVVHNFSHTRSKGARPDLKYEKDNIQILCSSVNRQDGKRGCHTLLHTNPEKFRERTI